MIAELEIENVMWRCYRESEITGSLWNTPGHNISYKNWSFILFFYAFTYLLSSFYNKIILPFVRKYYII